MYTDVPLFVRAENYLEEIAMNTRAALRGLLAAALLGSLVSCGGGSDSPPPPTYTVGGNIAGSAGVTLQINGANPLSVTALGSFAFPVGLTNGTAYTVTVSSAAQPCVVANGSGTMGTTNVTNVAITCTTVVRSALLDGVQENPANATTGTGRGAVVVNPTTKEITGGVTFTGLTSIPPTDQHIHQAPAGNPTANGGPIITLTLSPSNSAATIPAGTVLTDAQYTAFLAGELYFNIHTAANTGGEIRGRINTVGGVTAGLATLNGAQEVPTNNSTATGRGTIVFDSATRQLIIAYVTHNVPSASNAHVHTGAPGVSGAANVVNPMTPGTNVYAAPAPAPGVVLTPQNVTDINAGNTYFNVHSTNTICPPAANCAAGEIRGQIAVQ